MKKILYTFIFFCALCFFYSKTCFGYVIETDGHITEANYAYYTHELEPKLDILCSAVLKEATKIINAYKPVFEVTLTQKERHFSADSMEFFTGEREQSDRYSSVRKIAVWVYGLTLIEGWTRDNINYQVNYVYTKDTRFEPLSGINVYGDTLELEKFFNGRLYDISAEYGYIGHLQAVQANDDWSAVTVLVNYAGEQIKSIEAWDENVDRDNVPVVPKPERVKTYIQDMKQRIDWNAEHAFEQDLAEIRKRHNSLPSRADDTETEKKLGINEIIVISLSIGIFITLIAVAILNGLFTKTSAPKEIREDIKPREPHKEAYSVDMEFTAGTPADDFDYPYEDIGDALGERRHVE